MKVANRYYLLPLHILFFPMIFFQIIVARSIEGSSGIATKSIPESTYIESNRENAKLPKFFSVNQNYPNPFNYTTIMKYDLPQRSSVLHVIYNIFGNKIKTITNGIQEPGYYSVEWNGTDDSNRKLPSGVYLSLLLADDYYAIHKIVILK